MSVLNKFLRGAITIPAMKFVARRHYEAYERIVGGMSCGKDLAEHLSAAASNHKQKFNEAMTKLAVLDSNCPTFRLS